MAGLAFEIEVTGEEAIQKRLNELQSRAGDLSLLFGDIGEYLLLSHDERWRDQVDPDGNPWKPLSEEYLASKRKRTSAGRDKILVLDGYLSSSLSYQHDADSLEFGTNLIYAARQQFDYEREFIGLSADDEAEIMDLLAEYMTSEK